MSDAASLADGLKQVLCWRYGLAMRHMRSILLAGLIAIHSPPAMAQDSETPYWASIRVYRRKQLPLKVLRISEGWRLVEDPDGTKGWMVARFLSRDRTAIITGTKPAAMRAEPAAGARLAWKLEPGVVGALGECEAGWCRFDVGGRAGWVRQDRLWGASAP